MVDPIVTPILCLGGFIIYAVAVALAVNGSSNSPHYSPHNDDP